MTEGVRDSTDSGGSGIYMDFMRVRICTKGRK